MQDFGNKQMPDQRMDKLDIPNPFYDQKYQDMDVRLCKRYEDIAVVEQNMEGLQTRLENIRQQKNSGDNVYRFLFGITMQNHGDYNYTRDNYTQTIFLEDYEMAHPMAELVCCASI